MPYGPQGNYYNWDQFFDYDPDTGEIRGQKMDVPDWLQEQLVGGKIPIDWWGSNYNDILNTLMRKFQQPGSYQVPGIDMWSQFRTAVPGAAQQYPQNLWGMFTETAPGTSDQPWGTTDYMMQLQELSDRRRGEVDTFFNDAKWSWLSEQRPEEKALRELLEREISSYEQDRASGAHEANLQFKVAEINRLRRQIAKYEDERSDLKGDYQRGLGRLGVSTQSIQSQMDDLMNLLGASQQRKGMGMSGIQNLLGLGAQVGSQEQQAALQSLGLSQNEWMTALQGLSGFRGQDMEKYLQEMQMQMQMQMMMAQLQAAAEGGGTGFWDILGGGLGIASLFNQIPGMWGWLSKLFRLGGGK